MEPITLDVALVQVSRRGDSTATCECSGVSDMPSIPRLIGSRVDVVMPVEGIVLSQSENNVCERPFAVATLLRLAGLASAVEGGGDSKEAN